MNKKYEFSKKSLKDSIYKTAIEDFEDLTDLMKIDNYDFAKLSNMVDLRPCGKSEYDFEFNSLTITVERENKTYKIKTIRVYDLKSCEFLCYMKIKGENKNDNKKF